MRTKRLLLVALVCLVGWGCGNSPRVVRVRGLVAGGGGTATTDATALDIVIRFHADATGFNAGDLMRLFVNGTDRTDEALLGGEFAVLRLDPAPLGTQFVELTARTGPVIDSFTWEVMPYTGPTIASVAPATAEVGDTITITGTGFAAGTVRVFLGGAEATVTSSSATSIDVTVPATAIPGLVWVLVGADAAAGVVAFAAVDAVGDPLPAPLEPRLMTAFPGRAPAGGAVRIHGVGFDGLGLPIFNSRGSTVVIDARVVNLPPAGDLITAFAVIAVDTPPAVGTFQLEQSFLFGNLLPFTVE